MAKQFAFLQDTIPAVALPDLAAASVGDALGAVDRTLALTEQQTAALLGALQARLPADQRLASFRADLQADGTARISYRAFRVVRPAQVIGAVRSGLLSEIVGEVIDA